MANSHTPGPWELRPNEDGILSVLESQTGDRVCELLYCFDEDARLIAVTPLLLAALKRLMHIAVWDDDFDADDRKEFDAAYAEAEAAVAAAEGREVLHG